MNRTTAIILTIVTALFCGLPGIGLMCFAGFGMLGTNMPGFYEQNPGATPEQAWLGAGMFICLGLVLLVIPILVGVFSFRMSKPAEPTFNEPPPPAA
jgi:hypothetical protein